MDSLLFDPRAILLHAAGMHGWPVWGAVALLTAGMVFWRFCIEGMSPSRETSRDDRQKLDAAVSGVLQERGFAIPGTHAGRAFVANLNAKTVLVQIECQKGRVRRDSIRSALDASAAQHCDEVIVATNSSFNRAAASFARSHGVELLDGTALISRVNG